MKIYTYFVSYVIYSDDSRLGEGDTTVLLIDKKADSPKQIECIREKIVEDLKEKCKNININSVVIMCLYLLNEESVVDYVQ